MQCACVCFCTCCVQDRLSKYLGTKPPLPSQVTVLVTTLQPGQPSPSEIACQGCTLPCRRRKEQLLDPTRQSPEMAVFQVITTRRLET